MSGAMEQPSGCSEVEAPGIESPTTSAPSVVDRRDNDADRATQDDAKRREVSASTPPDVDEAILAAAKVAIDTVEYERARALVELLRNRPPTYAPVSILPTPKRN